MRGRGCGRAAKRRQQPTRRQLTTSWGQLQLQQQDNARQIRVSHEIVLDSSSNRKIKRLKSDCIEIYPNIFQYRAVGRKLDMTDISEPLRPHPRFTHTRRLTFERQSTRMKRSSDKLCTLHQPADANIAGAQQTLAYLLQRWNCMTMAPFNRNDKLSDWLSQQDATPPVKRRIRIHDSDDETPHQSQVVARAQVITIQDVAEQSNTPAAPTGKIISTI